MLYHVKWEIEIEADSEIDAAAKALDIQRDPGSTAVVFDVKPYQATDQKTRRIDLNYESGGWL